MRGEAESVFVGLGANLDRPEWQLQRALAALDALPASRLVACSAFYTSPPMGPGTQPDYVNAAVEMRTRLAPHSLLVELQTIEYRQGRRRDGSRWGPRTLDLDLLVYGGQQHATDALCIPHPGIATRPFVLLPLADLAPGLLIPGAGSVGALLAALGAHERQSLALIRPAARAQAPALLVR